MYSLRFTILFFLVLSVPFFLRWKELEPYPSILLPEGAHTYSRTNGNIDVMYDVLYGKNKAGDWQQVNIDSFMGQTPVQYYPYVMSKIFNGDSVMASSRRFRIMAKLPVDNRYKWTDNERTGLNEWVKMRFSSIGLDTSLVRRTIYEDVISTETKSLVSKNITSENTINLNE